MVFSGHSFGGMTVIAASDRAEIQPKAIVAMDPWLFAYCEEVIDGSMKVKCPMQLIHSETYHSSRSVPDFDSWKTALKCHTHSTEQVKRENIIMLKTGHLNQTDAAIYQPESVNKMYCQSKSDISTFSRLYTLNSHMQLKFLDNLDKVN